MKATICLLGLLILSPGIIKGQNPKFLATPEFFLRKHIASQVAPSYPEPAQQQGLQGTVLLFVAFDTDGKYLDAMILDSPHELLSESALQAVKEWTLKPYDVVDPSVTYLGELRFVFALKDNTGTVTDAPEADQKKVSQRFKTESNRWIRARK